MLLPHLHATLAIKLMIIFIVGTVNMHANVVNNVIAAFALWKINSLLSPLTLLVDLCGISHVHLLIDLIGLKLWHEELKVHFFHLY
jgi:hypothetical protein